MRPGIIQGTTRQGTLLQGITLHVRTDIRRRYIIPHQLSNRSRLIQTTAHLSSAPLGTNITSIGEIALGLPQGIAAMAPVRCKGMTFLHRWATHASHSRG
jgi:hypothetical protein